MAGMRDDNRAYYDTPGRCGHLAPPFRAARRAGRIVLAMMLGLLLLACEPASAPPVVEREVENKAAAPVTRVLTKEGVVAATKVAPAVPAEAPAREEPGPPLEVWSFAADPFEEEALQAMLKAFAATRKSRVRLTIIRPPDVRLEREYGGAQ